ncbi:hypothetical protein [Marinobacter antarcticus]|uniref:hypothetical protein n=1 Tax=Marinobacter antarcticus TaxID=564117 RepID=UPI001E642A35|nr:hypothetical protein [Marinobacter antarcticus]
MSGSLGVVLRPCLLTAAMFTLVAFTVNRQSKFDLAPTSQALPAMFRAFRPLIP